MPAFATAGISVTPILIDSPAGEATKQDIRVSNVGNETAYVTVTPKLMTNLGKKNEKAIAISDPQKLGIVVSPQKMVIPAGKFRLVRFVFTKAPGKTDHIYRVDIKPSVGDLIFPQDQKSKLGVKLLVGYGVVIIQRPIKINADIQLNRDGKILNFTNKGNTNVLLAGGKQCDAKGKNCKQLGPKRLYAGNTWQIKLPYDTPVSYQELYLNEVKTVKSK
tara:strand:+ start:32689 stop:33345 length:657 start_codon:yes stop_codon:yes gene_type:complete